MKKKIWIVITVLLSLGVIWAADAWVNASHTQQYIQRENTEATPEDELVKAPKDALESATATLHAALEQHDAPAVIASLVKSSTAQILIDRDSLSSIIRQTERLADRSTDPVEQSMLRLYTALLYNHFVENNYQIYDRKSINDFTQPIETWSENMFTTRIDTLFAQALAPKKVLLATPVKRYKEALSLGSDTLFRPSIYDFIIYQAIQHYQNKGEKPNPRQALLTRANIFVRTMESSEVYAGNRILKLYAEALKAYKYGSAPFMMWDLQRLEYIANFIPIHNDKKENTEWQKYLKILEDMLSDYQSNPYSVEIADVLIPKMTQINKQSSLNHALDLCDFYIEKYPEYPRTDCLRNHRNLLLAQELSLDLPSTFYPEEIDQVSLSHRNIENLTIKIYRQPNNLPFEQQWAYQPDNDQWSRENQVYSQSYFLGIDHGFRALVPEPSLEKRDKKIPFPTLAPGYYVIEMVIDGKAKEEAVRFAVSNVKAIERSTGKGKTEILTVNAHTGKPLSGATVSVYESKKGQYNRIATYKTNQNGLCQIDGESGTRFVTVASNGDSFAQPLSLREFYPSQFQNEDMQTALFTDRSLYRPGQTIYFSGVRYFNDAERHHTISGKSCKVELIDPSGKSIATQTLTTDEYGQFNGSFAIPRGNLLGDYQLRIDGRYRGSRSVSVAEYKLPAFKVEFDPVKEGVRFDKRIRVHGKAISYSGVPQTHAQVTYTIEKQVNRYFRTWLFENPETVAADTTYVNDKGEFIISFVPQRSQGPSFIHKEQAYTYIITANITASTGETVEQSTTVQVGDSPYFINVTAPQLLDKYRPAEQIKVSVRTLNGETVRRACRLVFYSLYDNPEIESLDSLKIKMQVGEATIDTEGNALYPDFSKWDSGPYRIVAFSNDDEQRIIRSECNFVLYSDKDKQPPRHTVLWLPRTQLEAQEGETVKIPLGSSLDEAYIFYSIYSADQLIETKMLKASNGCKTLDFTLDAKYGGIATINFLIVKDGKMDVAGTTIRQQVPERKLHITTASFRDKLLPGSTENWEFTVTDPEGKPVVARFMAEMFDASMQALRHHIWEFNAPVYHPYSHISAYPRATRYYTRRVGIQDTPKLLRCLQGDDTHFIYANLISYHRFSRNLFYGERAGYKESDAMPMVQTRRMYKSSITADAVAEEEIVEDIATGETGHTPIANDYRTGEVSTAFYYPTLTTDSLGNTTVSFTVPNENTTWQFYALAYTQELFIGQFERQTVASKPIMVSPNLPRFVRQGDEVIISTAVQNRTEQVQEGTILFELFDPYTDAIIHARQGAFITDADESKTLDYSFTVPEGATVLGFRVKAATSQHSDGEQQIIPVLPSKVLVTDSEPFYIEGGTRTTTVTMPNMRKKLKSSSVENYRMTLQYCNNPTWYAVQALPALSEIEGNNAISIMASLYANSIASQLVTANPRIAQAIESWKATGEKNLTSLLEQNEELKQVLLSATPWALQATDETERMQQLATLLDQNRANRLAQVAVSKLHNLQNNDGGISWFNGMNSSFSTTLNTLEGFTRLRAMGVAIDEGNIGNEIGEMQNRAIRFIDQEVVKRWNKNHKNSSYKNDRLSYSDLNYLYVRSGYRDIPLSGELLEIHKALVENLKHWGNFNNIEKAYTAIALHRYGFTQEAKEIIASLRQYAVTQADKGMFWPNSRSHYFYANGAVQQQCILFNAFFEVDPVTTELDQMRRWLLTQKQTNEWASVPSTLDAIYALTVGGSDWLAADNTTTSITWGGKEMEATPEEPFLGLTEYALAGKEITPTYAEATITTDHPQPSWGAIYWQYYDNVKNVSAAQGNDLALSRQIYVRQQSAEGTIYVPLHTTSIKPGDRVSVRLTISVGQDMQFVCLTDGRAACLEPADQLSEYECHEHICYYKEVGNDATRFYFEFLPKGTYVITHELNVDRPGEYMQGLSTIQCLYAPQIIARAAAQAIIVK